MSVVAVAVEAVTSVVAGVGVAVAMVRSSGRHEC